MQENIATAEKLHIAIIMDGNRRFAKKNSQFAWQGHEQGVKKLQEVVEWALESSVTELTLYTFSYENFNRDTEEIKYLMNMFQKQLSEINNDTQHKTQFHKHQIRLRFCGQLQLFNPEIQELMKSATKLTKDYSTLTINFALGYSGRKEIQEAFLALQKEGKDISQVSEQEIISKLSIPSDPELIIRTGGEKRLSNFLLYQSSYSELFFLDCLWPEFSKEQFLDIINSFKSRNRRFGK